jgi:hypothetical protein
VQEVPEAGYNFVQTYTFTNPSTEPMSLKMVLFNDQDHGDSIHDDRVGFASGQMPRMYFIEDPYVAGPGDPGAEDRPRRISVISQPGPGVRYDGYLGVNPEAWASNFVYYAAANLGIGDEFLNSIRQMNVDFNSATLTDVNRDTDGDGLIDSPGDVGGALQFSVDLPANGSTTFGINYVGGSLENAVFHEAAFLPGDFDNNGSLNLVDVNDLTARIAGGAHPTGYDLNDDAKVDQADLTTWVKTLRTTWIGDANLDGEFNSGDLIQVFAAGKYELNGDASWDEGDWTGDRRFNSGDIVSAFQDGGYERGPVPASAVPEPGSGLLLGIAGVLLICARSKARVVSGDL